jgi:hypothetical protein
MGLIIGFHLYKSVGLGHKKIQGEQHKQLLASLLAVLELFDADI